MKILLYPDSSLKIGCYLIAAACQLCLLSACNLLAACVSLKNPQHARMYLKCLLCKLFMCKSVEKLESTNICGDTGRNATGTLALARIAVKRIAPLGGAKYQQLNFVASSLSANKQCFVTPSTQQPSTQSSARQHAHSCQL